MSNMESLPAQEYNAPFRVDKTGLTLREEWKELSQDPNYLGDLETNMIQAETAGRFITTVVVEEDTVS